MNTDAKQEMETIDRRGRNGTANQCHVPIVSVVIPTRDRKNMAYRAAVSALAQTLREIEVLVVINGVDPETAATLIAIKDSRLRIVCLPSPVSNSEARNIGIRKSRGRFVALLDDADEWQQDKLSLQLNIALKSGHCIPVVTCRIVARRGTCGEVWPTRPKAEGEPMGDYLLCREDSIRRGEGAIQISTLFAPRSLLLAIPFRPELARHEDWEWLLQAAIYPGVGFEWVWDVLVICEASSCDKSQRQGASFDSSCNWVKGNQLLTAKARAYFYATELAAHCRTKKMACAILRKTLRCPRALLMAVGVMLAPPAILNRLRQNRATNEFPTW